MGRQLYLVAYDIAAPDRLRRALAAVKPWRAAGQKSVSECFLFPAERDALCNRLVAIIDPCADRAHILRLDPRMAATMLGVARHYVGGPFLVE